jgi:hypothetical protein
MEALWHDDLHVDARTHKGPISYGLRHYNRVFSLRADRLRERIRKRLRSVKVASSKVGIPNAFCAILELAAHVDGDR